MALKRTGSKRRGAKLFGVIDVESSRERHGHLIVLLAMLSAAMSLLVLAITFARTYWFVY